MFDEQPLTREQLDESEMQQAIADNIADDQLITLDVLQTQLKPWQLYNFGTGPAFHPLLGLIEEIGEICAAYNAEFSDTMTINDIDEDDIAGAILAMSSWLGKIAHAHLKASQNIRGTSDEHKQNMQSALINLSSLARALYITDLPNNDTSNDIEAAFILATRTTVVGFPESKDTIEDGLADTLVYAADFSNRLDINLTKGLDVTWKKVRKRDWVQHRKEAAAKKDKGRKPDDSGWIKTPESSQIIAFKYDNSTNDLTVKFKGNSVYRYASVPVAVYNEMRHAESVGKFLSSSIKGTYNYVKVSDGGNEQ